MSETSSLTSPVVHAYAWSLFSLAEEAKLVDAVEKELLSFMTLYHESADLQRLIKSPVFSTEEQFKAMSTFVQKAGFSGKGASGLAGNFFCVVAEKRRLFILPAMVEAYSRFAANYRGEIDAEVVCAAALSAAEQKELKATLKEVAGKDVRLRTVVDPSILAGLVVRIGSRQIDTSLKTKLSALKHALKEVG